MMNFIRTLIFWIILTPITLVMTSILLLGPDPVRNSFPMGRRWSRIFHTLAAKILGIRVTVRGTLPDYPVIIASKHQAALETFLIPYLMNCPAIILKKSLMQIPFFGQALRVHGAIPIDRDPATAASSLRFMLKQAKASISQGRSVIIYPEGHRIAAGAPPPPIKKGASALYKYLNIPVVPVALDTGHCWPRGFAKCAGHVTIRFLDPIPPGMEMDAFTKCLSTAINSDPKA